MGEVAVLSNQTAGIFNNQYLWKQSINFLDFFAERY